MLGKGPNVVASTNSTFVIVISPEVQLLLGHEPCAFAVLIANSPISKESNEIINDCLAKFRFLKRSGRTCEIVFAYPYRCRYGRSEG